MLYTHVTALPVGYFRHKMLEHNEQTLQQYAYESAVG